MTESYRESAERDTLSKNNSGLHVSTDMYSANSSALGHISSTTLYLLRLADANDDWKIQAVFEPDIKFDFTPCTPFKIHQNYSQKKDNGPWLYRLCLDVTVKNDGSIYVFNNSISKPVEKYKIRIAKPRGNLICHYDEGFVRSLMDINSMSHQFLFDIEFKDGVVFDTPGSSIGLWNHLWLYTYFFISSSYYDAFELLFNQFEATINNMGKKLSQARLKAFLEICHNKYSVIEKIVQVECTAIKMLVRMFSLLSINKDNLVTDSTLAAAFASIILKNFGNNFGSVWKNITDDEFPSFCQGFATLTCIRLLYQENESQVSNIIDLLSQIPEERRREYIVLKLLDFLNNLQQRVPIELGKELFKLVNHHDITLEHLKLAASLDSYIKYVHCLLEINQDHDKKLIDEISDQFDNLIAKDHFPITFQIIAVILHYLKQPTDIKSIQSIIYIIQSSNTFRLKIEEYLNSSNHHIILDDIPYVSSILITSYNPYLLHNINRQEYLSRTLSRRPDCTCDYLVVWFKLLLCVPDENYSNYKYLVSRWTECFVQDQTMFFELIQQMDLLIELWESAESNNTERLNYFVPHMITQCFRQDNIIDLVIGPLRRVKNRTFIQLFVRQYKNEKLVHMKQHQLKEFDNAENPLIQLIKAARVQRERNEILKEMITLFVSNIDIKSHEIIKETFDYPSKDNFTCVVLFDELFTSLPVYKLIINCLNEQWKKWEENGLLASDIRRWNMFLPEQKNIVCKISALVAKETGRKDQLETIFESSHQQMKSKLEVAKKITACLHAYCQQASDLKIYHDLVKTWNTRFEVEPIHSIDMPSELTAIIPFSEKLNPYSTINSWQNFLKQHIQRSSNQLLTSEYVLVNTKQSIRQQYLLNEETLDDILTQDRTTRDESVTAACETDIMSCFDILERAVCLFESYRRILERVNQRERTISVNFILDLFPNINEAERDLQLLSPLLEQGALSTFLHVTSFWKSRIRIQHICTGIILLNKKFSTNMNLTFLHGLLSINEQTYGETCAELYQKYQNGLENKCTPKILELLSYYSSSREVFDFADSLLSDGIYHLQEGVNDWDDTLLNTKTIFDFSVVKRFIDLSYGAIIDKQKALDSSSMSFNDLMKCFEETWADKQFENLLTCLQTSTISLASIKRIHLELTDKEQSKRRQIADIVQLSNIDFVSIGHYGIKFDVSVERPANDKRPRKKLTFADLGELRDRARLLEYSSNMKDSTNERDIETLRIFIQLINIIEISLETLGILEKAGYPSISIFISPAKQFQCMNGKYDELIKNNESLKHILNDWEQKLLAMYEIHPNLTYFTGGQLRSIENYIQNPISTAHQGFHLLKFIGINPESISNQTEISPKSEDCLENIGRLLSQLNQDIPHRREIPKTERILLVQTTNEGILRAILSLFRKANAPVHIHHVFYCTLKTNWVEIRAFIYRCFYSQTFHQLIRPEYLSQSVQDQFIGLIRSLIREKPDHNFQIGIITTLPNQQLINGLRSMRIVDILRDQDLLNAIDFLNLIQEMNRNCVFVASSITGLGKSTIIRQKIQRSKKNYVKFPIYGDADVDTLAERLCSKYHQLQTGAIHLDIGTTADSQQLNEILYCLLLFRSFRFGHIATSIPAETTIYIEFDSSPESILHELPFFDHITPSVSVAKIDWTTIDVQNEQIQTVAKYFNAIINGDILTNDINSLSFTNFDSVTCSRLLQGVFLPGKDDQYVTWTQLWIFISVVHRLFNGFSRCGYFLVRAAPSKSLRMHLVQTILRSSEQFTSLSVESVRKQQRSAMRGKSIAFSDAIVRWDTIQPFTLIFTASDEPIFVYKTPKDVPEVLLQYFQFYCKILRQNSSIIRKTIFPDYNTLNHGEFFLKLSLLSNKFINKSICLTCFRSYDIKQQKCETCLISDLVRPKSLKHEDIEKFQLLIAKKLQIDYVLTADNFIKMLLVYVRVQSNIPVLIMGETGCGKTSLIQFLCQKVLDEDLAVFRIHAGVTAEMIVNTMNQYIQQAENYTDKNKRLWVFFDEFNTTENIGLIKEIICERTLLGRPLPRQMVFLGACNPRRQKLGKAYTKDDAHVGIRKNRYEMNRLHRRGIDQSLLFTVVPIPETMLEYIWDYGYLNQATETAYIRTMLNMCDHLTANQVTFDLTVNLLVQSQLHLRQIEDVSSVSLRDIARFCRLYNWFFKSLNQRMGTKQSNDGSNSSIVRSSLVALMLCYYFRLQSDELKRDYVEKMEAIIVKVYPKLRRVSNYLTKHILECEQNKLISDKMEIPPNTALNRALRDNIFVVLACIVNRIPLFLCGKPGSSKSSAVQIVISNLKGKNSRDPYFQTVPELVPVSFQGSQNCTSESIIKVFERASKYLGVRNESEVLPVIVFDEIGLAELSIHNPLKVLHAELEVENNKYGFVGVSNWRLDAAKMNRALYLSTTDPNVEDLQLTGLNIAQTMQQQSEKRVQQLDKITIDSLSQAYYDLSEHLRETQSQYKHYFGLRDYYSLIKGIVYEAINTTDNIDMNSLIRKQLKINFDGSFDGSTFIWEHFCNHMNNFHLAEEYRFPSFNHLLDRTLHDRSSRYLLLIADSDSMMDHVERYIYAHQKRQKISVRTLVGSSFPNDLLFGNIYAEDYNYRVLMDIILYAETNVTLIMRQMGHLYDNLYDLFNQNFAVSAKKKYCRIALGPLYHPRCFVHDDFYCVVFIHKRDLNTCDPPFLNRFEKHLIDLRALISPQHWALSQQLYAWVDSCLPKNLGDHFPLLQHLFVDYSQDQLCNLVIEAFEHFNISTDVEANPEKVSEIINYCQEKLLRTSSLDLPLVLSIQPTVENQKLIEQYYKSRQSFSFSKFVQQALDESVLPLQIIYTYTQIYHEIDGLPVEVEEVKLSAFKTELELVKKLKHHYQTSSTKTRLLIIRVDYHDDHQHILSLKYAVQNQYESNSNRGIWLVFHLQRNVLNQINNDVLFSGWSIDMIDDLNERQLIPKEVLNNPSYHNLVLRPEHRLSDSLFDELVDRCLSKFRHIIFQTSSESEIHDRRHKLLQYIIEPRIDSTSKDLHLRSIIIENLMMLIEKFPPSNKMRFVDWRMDLLTNAIAIAGSRSFYDGLQMIISTFYEAYLSLLLAHLEKYQLLDAYIFLSNNQDENIQQHLSRIWMDCLKSSLANIDITQMNLDVIEIPYVLGIRLPGAVIEYESIRCTREKFMELNESSVDLYDFHFDKMHVSNIYDEEFLELVFSNKQLFEYYFHDQIAMYLADVHIQLSTSFVYDLLTSNPTRTFKQYKRLFFVEHVELSKIFRLFEISLQLVNEDDIQNIIKDQLIQVPSGTVKSSKFYTLVLYNNEKFYQLPPSTLIIDDKWIFECAGDPMIETSLMNLIELILSPSVIQKANSIQQITTTYSLIAQGIRDLDSYSVNNLEKLRSFISLIRCLTTLLSHKAIDIFKRVCNAGFHAEFDTCSSIHDFIMQLQEIIKQESLDVDENIVRRALNKLELDFLKDWLADHDDSYGEILKLMNEPDNDLWFYSAKIFTLIDKKINLVSTLRENHGQLPLDDEYKHFNQSLEMCNGSTSKIERLMVNRLHMHLILPIQTNEVEQQLTDEYEYFLENVQEIQDGQLTSVSQRIFLLAWLKYYAQMYAFALNLDSKETVMSDIDQFLTNLSTPFAATLKIFILKQTQQISRITLADLRETYVNRLIYWIQPFLKCLDSENIQSVNQVLTLPVPLFQCRKEFEQISNAFKNSTFQRIIENFDNEQKTIYAFLCWFIEYYSRFSQSNTKVDANFVRTIHTDCSQDLIRILTPLGHRLLFNLCSNFSDQSYFRLHPNMKSNDIHKRLIAVTIIAVFISFKPQSDMTLLGNILFDNKGQIPNNYAEHFAGICLPGLTVSNIIISQMMYVRTRVEERLNQNKYVANHGKFIFQCSEQCPWMFFFEDCGAPNDKSVCSLCQKAIGSQSYGVLIKRDPPQLQMPIHEAFEKIDKYINEYGKTIRFGYHYVKSAKDSSASDKPAYLNQSVSFRFIHFLMHTVLWYLQDQNYLTDADLKQYLNLSDECRFLEHFEKDYELLCQTYIDSQQCYIWLYKLLNHLVDDEFNQKGQLNTNESVKQIELLIEEKLIFKHIQSIDNEIGEYKKSYAEYIQKQNSLESFIDELFEDEEHYPYLNFFNITTFHTSNPLDDFILKIQNLPFSEKTYPVSTYLLKRLDDFTNIQYLYPLVSFVNYLISKLNHRIKRMDAVERKMVYYLRQDADQGITKRFYDEFLNAWYGLNFTTVRSGCQTLKFERNRPKENFAENTSIAMLLLTSSKDESMLLLACLKTIAELQNEVVNHFYNKIENVTETTKNRTPKRVPLQSVRPEHILSLIGDFLSEKLVKDCLVVNYQYGNSKDIFYDFEEIEITLRNMISSLVLIDTDQLHLLTYQFELYGENTSLINDVRARIKQEQIVNDERTKWNNLITKMNADEILHNLGFLDNIFTYIRTISSQKLQDNLTIQVFIEKFIHSNDNVFHRSQFSSISLKNIIDFYEMLEEIAFDQVLRAYVKKELTEENFKDDERKRVIQGFVRATLENEKTAKALQSIDTWISVLKRLIVRVLNASVALDVPLQIYLERTDLWSDRINQDDLQTFEIADDILLQHTYIILIGLEEKMSSNDPSKQNRTKSEIQSVKGQQLKASTWLRERPKTQPIGKNMPVKKIRAS